MQSTFPSNKFKPIVVFPFSISTLRFYTNSALSNPPLSAIINGSYLNALANASIANAVFPFTDFAKLSTAAAILISEFPPP